jgi:hypothetical protein
MKQILTFFGLILITSGIYAQSPRIRLNQITKDSITGSILISSLADSNMVYSRDFYINAADTSLVFYGTTIVSGSGGGSFITSTILSDSLVNYITKLASFGGDVSGTYDAIVVADNSHDHTISNVTGLQTALDGKSNVGHTHVISDITGLQTALDGKQAQLNGTGFVKALGTTISYDNSTYLTTEVDGSVTNEGSLSVGAGGANDAVINSNTSGSTGVTIAGGSNITITESGSTITISADSVGGGGGGGTVTEVIAGTQISGMEMSIATSTTTPTISTSITNAANFRTAIGAGTLSTEVDGSVTNEGALSVGAGGANDAVINSNTSGSTGVTIAGGTGIAVTESGSTITITNTGGVGSSNYDSLKVTINGNVNDNTFYPLPFMNTASNVTGTYSAFIDSVNSDLSFRPTSATLRMGALEVNRTNLVTQGISALDGLTLWTNSDSRLNISNTGNFNFIRNDNALESMMYVSADSNRVGIGTTTPESLLDVKGQAKAFSFYALEDSATVTLGAYSPLNFNFSGPTGNLRNMNLRFSHSSNFNNSSANVFLRRGRGTIESTLGVLNNDLLGNIYFSGALTTGDLGNPTASVSAYADADATSTDTPARLSFSTGSTFGGLTERLTIKSDGKVGIGTTAPSDQLHTYKASGSVANKVQSGDIGNTQFASFTAEAESRTSALGVYKHSGITNNAGYLYLSEEDGGDAYLWADNSRIFRISDLASNIGTTGGTVVGSQTSDQRLKNDLGTFNYGLNQILAIQPRKFVYKNDESNQQYLGFYAQEILPIIPEAVYDTNEPINNEIGSTKLAMTYVTLIPVLTKAIQEQQAIIDQQKTEIDLLKNQIQVILEKLAILENK